MSPTTILHLFDPPNISSPSSYKYKSIIHARPYQPHNNDHPSSPRYHFCHAQVRIIYEFFFFSSNSSVISCDNKNKVSIGKPAVHRLNRAKKWFMKEDEPKLSTHDFPKPFHIVPSGYLILKWKDNSHTFRETELDCLLRKHVSIPRTGSLYLFNRADYFFNSNISSHIVDLKQVMSLEGTKKNVLLIVDRGPDNTWKGSLINLVQYGILWRDSKLQNLAITGYAPEDSAFNPIERSYSSRTVDITGTVISDTINGKKITKQSLKEEIKIINDNGVNELTNLWNTKTYDGFQVHSFAVPSSESTLVHEFDHSEYHKYLKGIFKINSEYLLNTNNLGNSFNDCQKNKILTFIIDHCIKTLDLLWFGPCYLFNRPSCDHCLSLGDHSEMLQFLTKDLNGIIPFPIKSTEHDNHFKTFFELVSSPENTYHNLSTLKSCDLHTYHFDSEADKRRHFNLFHGGQPTVSYEKDYFKCEYMKNKTRCSFKCDSLIQFNQHLLDNHPRVNKEKKKEKRAQNGQEKKTKKSKQNKVKRSEDKLDNLKRKSVDEKVGRNVKVWYQTKQKGYYAFGKVVKYVEGDDYQIEWDNYSYLETVSLKDENCTDDTNNNDRWLFDEN